MEQPLSEKITQVPSNQPVIHLPVGTKPIFPHRQKTQDFSIILTISPVYNKKYWTYENEGRMMTFFRQTQAKQIYVQGTVLQEITTEIKQIKGTYSG